jgi:F-type H+-transporting ATPase subunit epsilon
MADSAGNKVILELVIPTALAVSEEVDMVVVPGYEGDFGVLYGHTPILTTIRPGVISIYTGEEITKSFFVEGGFAEVDYQQCTILAESATDVSDISSEIAETRLLDARAALENSDNPATHKEVRIAEAMCIAVSSISTQH